MTRSSLLPEEIQTERLLVRVARPGDGAMFNHAIVESLADLEPWLGWVTPAPTLEASEQSCRPGQGLITEGVKVLGLLAQQHNWHPD